MQKIEMLKKEIQKVIVGQDEMIEAILVALLSSGHILLEGMPGLAKTTAVKTFAKTLGLSFARVQFTPDLLPSDIIGANIYNPAKMEFFIKKGPVFANLLLADEINRAPAKVQSALLEAMQERQVTIDNQTFALPKPFLVMATQNPIEQEGTYNLPEAQLDRFMMKILLDVGSREDELEILERSEREDEVAIEQVFSQEELLQAAKEASQIYVDKALKEYIVDIIFATRKHPKLRFGSSPRGGIELLKAAKAKAYIEDQEYVTPEFILQMAKPILRHRVILDYEAKAQGLSSDAILGEILEEVPVP